MIKELKAQSGLIKQLEEEDLTSGNEQDEYVKPGKVKVGVKADGKIHSIGSDQNSTCNSIGKDLLMQTRIMREINQQADDIRKINTRMFTDKRNENETQKLKKRIAELEQKLRDRQAYVIEQKVKTRE